MSEAVLSRSAFLVLLALADRARHGLGIIEDVEVRTEGAVRLGPGTLYGTLHKLAADGLIRETSEVPDPSDDDSRRRYYRITTRGARALRGEAERMSVLVSAAVNKRVLEGL
jgi:DNA-binding PadR family transcriptional regulator